jgi:predicted DNA-binding transcriptional regulator AlpA
VSSSATVSTREACAILGVSRQALYQGMRRGLYPAPIESSRGVGTRSLWLRSAILGAMARGKRATTRESALASGAGPLLEGLDAALMGWCEQPDGARTPIYDRAVAVELLSAAGMRDAGRWVDSGVGASIGVVWLRR